MSAPDITLTPALEPKATTSRQFPTVRTILALMLREMSTRYGKNPGGYIWAVLQPLGAIMVLSVGFSLLMRSPSLGTSFLLFYATAYLVFDLYQSISSAVARGIIFSKPLLQYPAVTWVDALLARFFLNFLTGATISYLLLSGILTAIDTRVVLDLTPIVLAMSLAGLLGFGIGTLNCALGGLYPTWDIIWSILTRPLFVISCIFFLFEDMPPWVQSVLWWNPLAHVTGIMRTGFYPMYKPQYVSPAFVLTVALISLFFGLLLLRRHHRRILSR